MKLLIHVLDDQCAKVISLTRCTDRYLPAFKPWAFATMRVGHIICVGADSLLRPNKQYSFSDRRREDEIEVSVELFGMPTEPKRMICSTSVTVPAMLQV